MIAVPYSEARQISSYSGNMAAGLGGAAEIWHLRNGSTRPIVIPKLSMCCNVSTAFVAGAVRFTLNKYAPWSSDGTGGAALDLSAKKFKMYSSSGDSGFLTGVTWRTATTAALGAGTKTLDSQVVGILSGVTAVASDAFLTNRNGILIDSERFPQILGPNEGLVIAATVPATGVWAFCINGILGVLI